MTEEEIKDEYNKCIASFEYFKDKYIKHKRIKDVCMPKDKLINSDNKRQSWTYITNGVTKRVWCTRHEYLLLKLSYDDRGLTDEEYKEYKNKHN